jgi:hypothetical protein
MRPLAQSAGWGTGEVKASERVYYTNTLHRVVRHWQEQMLREASVAEDGRVEDPYHVYLIIDTSKPAVWIEQNGRVLLDNYTELPESMTWNVYRRAPEGNTGLGQMVRLKIRGVHGQRLAAEEFSIGASRRGMGYWYVHFNVQQLISGGSDTLTTRPYRGAKPQSSEDTYGSIVVSDEEYQQYQEWLAASGTPVESRTDAAEKSSLAANRANWLKVEKLLCQMIEAQVRHVGLNMNHLELGVGPDYTAAHAELLARDDSVIRDILGTRRSGAAYLRIDSLPDGNWYARSGPYPASTRQGSLDLEFLVRADGEIPKAQYDEWMKKGRQKQQDITVPPSKWRTTLPNGATVEFIGVCENPSAGKKWWGPDGGTLGYSPYWNTERRRPKGADGDVFEIAWRIYWPPSRSPNPGAAVRYHMEGALSDRSVQTRDRYGARIHNLTARSCAFEKRQKQTAVQVGVATFIQGQFQDDRVPDKEFRWVRFKNISLVSGENRGFEIELED